MNRKELKALRRRLVVQVMALVDLVLTIDRMLEAGKNE